MAINNVEFLQPRPNDCNGCRLGSWFFSKSQWCDSGQTKRINKHSSGYRLMHVVRPYINHLRIAHRSAVASSAMGYIAQAVNVSYVRYQTVISKTESRLLCVPEDSKRRDGYYRRNSSESGSPC